MKAKQHRREVYSSTIAVYSAESMERKQKKGIGKVQKRIIEQCYRLHLEAKDTAESSKSTETKSAKESTKEASNGSDAVNPSE